MATTECETRAPATQHVIALALSGLPPASLASSGAVSQLWHSAAAEALGSISTLDLRPFALTLTDSNLERLLERAPMLHELNLTSCVHITDRGLACLPARCPHLRDLNLACLPLITADGVEAVTKALPIASLELAGCSIPGAELVRRFACFLELDDDEDGLAKVQG